jgi:pimeloyl-ACP methyl ester carboxylesterase
MIDRRRGLRILRLLAAAIVAFAVLGAGAFAITGKDWIANAIVVAPNRGRALRVEDDPGLSQLADLGVRRQLRVGVGPPAASLSVWILEPDARPRATVVVLHGIRSEKFWQLGLARQIVQLGYRAVVPDLRGHGRSSGEFLTYGVLDARDLSQLVDALDREGLLSGHLGAVGTSYGAATAIEFAAVDRRVAGVVAIAPFSSLEAVVPAYARHYAPGLSALLPDSFVADAVARAGKLGGFDPSEASPLAAVSKTSARILLIHGRDDTNIPPSHSEAIRAAAPARCRLILVDHADHFSIASDPSGAIAHDGMAWLRSSLEPAP